MAACADVDIEAVSVRHNEPAFATPNQPALDAPLAWRMAVDANARATWYEAIATRPPDPPTLTPKRPEPVPAPAVRKPPSRSYSGGSHRGYATAKECVMWTENGGDYGRSTNPSHFGRFQFSVATWRAYGGNPATWGHASPAEQDEVFKRAWNSPGGPSNWLPYDGC